VKRPAALVAAFALAGCGSSSHQQATSGFCSGSGSPTVVLIPGFRATHTAWAAVQPRVAQFTHVCSYDAVADVDATGPLVIVGHSRGGIGARTYTLRHPRDVKAMVLVDSLPRGMRDSPQLGRKPLIVIQAGREISDQVPARTRFRLNRMWTDLQADLAALSTDHIQVVAATSTHDVPRDQPEVIATAIRAVVDAARAHRHLRSCTTLFARVAAQCVATMTR
jgi:pimeloyl-ACP methyl ester carboxylesterase